mmetsp:Transcript_710/g.1370  ORF Transcript_710/g.1370 Transcript_710/m.1370 type:complete len:109 (+) Transcript_710:366-692(+)
MTGRREEGIRRRSAREKCVPRLRKETLLQVTKEIGNDDAVTTTMMKMTMKSSKSIKCFCAMVIHPFLITDWKLNVVSELSVHAVIVLSQKAVHKGGNVAAVVGDKQGY